MKDDDRIRRARQANLPDYLLGKGEKLIKNGRRYRHAEHDSLVFTDSAYYWNARGEHGNAIDFLMSFYGMCFNEAVLELIGEEIAGQQKKGKTLPTKMVPIKWTENCFSFSDIALCPDMRRVIGYLTKTRGIDYSLIEQLIRDKRIFQEYGTNNAVFPIYDENSRVVGAETVGTLSFDNARYKGLKADSANGYGYSVGHKNNPGYILFFESAIDLLSFITIMRSRAKSLTSCLLVSMAGLKLGVVQKSLRVFGNSVTIPVLCVDNDEAGSIFIARCLTQHPAARIKQPDKSYKDWNDQLRGNCIRFI